MEKLSLKERVLLEIKYLISSSCPHRKVPKKFNNLHQAILKNHFNAADVLIDYQRKRVVMNIVLDDNGYNPREINTFLPLMPSNFMFRNLNEFLLSCVDDDNKSVAFYAGLIRAHTNREVALSAV